MAIEKLSAREVLAARDGELNDGGGLLLRVKDASSSWVLRYTGPSGRRREMGLGVADCGSVAKAGDSLASARRLAHEKREMLARGVDPIDERKRLRRAEREAELAGKADRAREQRTLARVAREYHQTIIEPSKTAKHGAQWIASLENNVPAALWNAPIDRVTAPALLEPMVELQLRIPETASRVRQRLDAIFEHAAFHGWCTGNAAAAIKRKLREAAPRRKAGALAALKYTKMPAFVAQLRSQEGIAARALEFVIYTAARTGEVIGARWSEFDLEAATWVVPAERMKAREEHYVHLSEPALAILGRQKELGQAFVFPSPMLDDSGLSNMAMLTLLRRMDQDKATTVHGFRSAFSS